jgi:hypothetical protein
MDQNASSYEKTWFIKVFQNSYGTQEYCDRFDSTLDMNAATQRIIRPSLGNDSVNNA